MILHWNHNPLVGDSNPPAATIPQCTIPSRDVGFGGMSLIAYPVLAGTRLMSPRGGHPARTRLPLPPPLYVHGYGRLTHVLDPATHKAFHRSVVEPRQSTQRISVRLSVAIILQPRRLAPTTRKQGSRSYWCLMISLSYGPPPVPCRFQLLRAGLLVDPRIDMRTESDRAPDSVSRLHSAPLGQRHLSARRVATAGGDGPRGCRRLISRRPPSRRKP
jgi:hypothetical protein